MWLEDAWLNYAGQLNYWAMHWTNEHLWPTLAGICFVGTLIRMTPLSIHHEHPFHQVCFVWVRRGILVSVFLLFAMQFFMFLLYDMTTKKDILQSQQEYLAWLGELASYYWWFPPAYALAGFLTRFFCERYILTWWSSLLKKTRNTITSDSASDIRDELGKNKAKDYKPKKYYNFKKGLFFGLDEDNNPIYIPWDIWYENMMQIIGPTGKGKGVAQGCLLDQLIEKNDTVFFIDPKQDKFAPHIMYQKCKEMGRKFYYVSLRDGDYGQWAPFAGGSAEDAADRLLSAFNIQLTGEPKTDYYKRQEIRIVKKALAKTRKIDALYNLVEEFDESTVKAELEVWKEHESLCPKTKSSFSIEKAIKENAVVYVKGALRNAVIKTATKVFVVELMQEIDRLHHTGEKQSHVTVMVDEVSFLISKELKEGLATIRGFGANFALAYQSPEDLVNVDDVNINGRALKQSVDQNCQIRAVYGGTDDDTAEWISSKTGTIQKEVTKMERTDVSATGGETWDSQRTVGALEENLISSNTILSLPQRVCALVAPNMLAHLAFTSFIQVKDMDALPAFLESKNKAKGGVSHAKLEVEDEPEEPKKKSVTPPEEFINVPEPTPKNDVENSVTEVETHEESTSSSELSAAVLETLEENQKQEEQDKKREANRSRRKKQKAKKAADSKKNQDENNVATIDQKESEKPTAKKEHKETDFEGISFKADNDALKALNLDDEEED